MPSIKNKQTNKDNASRLFKSDDHVNLFQCFVRESCWSIASLLTTSILSAKGRPLGLEDFLRLHSKHDSSVLSPFLLNQHHLFFAYFLPSSKYGSFSLFVFLLFHLHFCYLRHIFPTQTCLLLKMNKIRFPHRVHVG